ncbi:MAG: biotin--[acetyl-CoA-carboxylase] ligase [Bacteroidales bacterium]|nr:biotin--[acetyl-CoA-carboxylase] ligase [Bacteroidales bacterium]
MNLKFNIRTVPQIASTNKRMQELAEENQLQYGDVLRAVNQNFGIGQQGNAWESEAGKNLTFSLYLEELPIQASQIFQLNKIISLAMFDYLIAHSVENVKIKWPNDLYVENKKIAGMLTHNRFFGNQLKSSIVGIGLNVNQMHFLSDAPNPISLTQITNQTYSVEEELQKLLNEIANRMTQIENETKINSEYLAHVYGFDSWRNYKDESGTFQAIIKGVDEYGRLQLEKKDGEIATYDIKAIEFLL